jgi:hypothetical protein
MTTDTIATKSRWPRQLSRQPAVLLLCAFAVFSVGSCAAQTAHLEIFERSHSLHQHFSCTVGYVVADCARQLAILRRLLDQYNAEELGEWHWVLVARAEWKPLLKTLDQGSIAPALTSFLDRQTLLDESLFSADAERARELLFNYRVPLQKLLNLAVTHELAHAACREPNEEPVERAADRLRHGLTLQCPVTAKQATITARR